MLKRVINLIPLVVGLAVIVLVLVGYRADQENHQQQIQAQVTHALTTVKSELEAGLEANFHLIRSLEAYLQVNPDMNQSEFAVLAATLLADGRPVRALELARDDRVSHVFPPSDLDKEAGRDLTASGSAPVRALALRAKETGRMQILAPDLMHPERKSIVIVAPVRLAGPAGTRAYWGLILVDLDARAFFEAVDVTRFLPDVTLSLRKPEPPPDRDQMLSGDPLVFDMDPAIRDIDLPGGRWQLAAAPAGGWHTSPRSSFILFFGAMATILIPASLWAVAKMILGRLKDRERYHQLIHNAKSIILRIDLCGHIVFCNEYAEEFYGYAPGELLDKPLVGTLIPRRSLDGQSMRLYLSKLLKNPSAHPFNETMNLRKNGEIVWVAWANDAVLSGDGQTVGLLCVGTDITDRKLMEEALRQREKQYRLLAENVTDIIWGLDADFRLTYVSPSDEAVRGFKRHDVLGRPIGDFLTPGSMGRFNDALTVLNDLADQGEIHASVTEDMEFACADGTTVWLESHLGTLLNEEGERIGIQGVSRDITDRKLAEALRDDMERMARHDLKTPLGAVIGLPEEIRKLGGLTSAQEVMLETVENAGRAMLQLINRSLDLYKMECGTYVLDRTTVDVLKLIDRVKAESLPQIREKGISVGIEARNGGLVDTFPVSVDQDLFRSMLANLVRNALDASPESGSITLLLEKGEHITIRIRNQGEVDRAARDLLRQVPDLQPWPRHRPRDLLGPAHRPHPRRRHHRGDRHPGRDLRGRDPAPAMKKALFRGPFDHLGVELLHQPGHVLAEDLHGVHALLVLEDLAGVAAEAHVPVARAGHDHLGDEEEGVEGVEGLHGPAAPGRDHARPDLAGEHAAVDQADHARAVDERAHLGGDGGEIGRRAEEDAVGLVHGLDTLVDEVVPDRAAAVLVLGALVAGDAAVHLLAGQFDHLGLDALGLELLEDLVDHQRGIAALAGRAVECDHFHVDLLIGVVVHPVLQEPGGRGHGLRGPAHGGETQRDDLIREVEHGPEPGDAVCHGVDAGPDRAQAQPVGGQEQVLHGRGAVQDPVARVLFLAQVAADQDAERGLGDHLDVRVEVGHGVEPLAPGDHHELPRLRVARARGHHGRVEHLPDQLVRHVPVLELADAAPGAQGFHHVHRVAP